MARRIESLVYLALALAFLMRGGIGIPFSTPGARHVLIVRDTLNDSPAMNSQFLLLRSGAHEAYLKSKGHTLDILDDQKPEMIPDSFKPYAMPEVLVIDPPSKLLARKHFTTAEDTIDLLKKNGG